MARVEIADVRISRATASYGRRAFLAFVAGGVSSLAGPALPPDLFAGHLAVLATASAT